MNRLRSSIDIGTNTVLLLVAEQRDNILIPIFEKQEIPRLGKGVDENRMLSKDSMQRVLSVLMQYKQLLNADFQTCEDPIVSATSAVRDAKNRNEFISLVKQQTGFDIRLLSGKEEAEWTYAGALSVLKTNSQQKYCVIDIGGGSTEFAFGKGADLEWNHSFDIGSVRFTERFINTMPTTDESIKKVVRAVEKEFELFNDDFRQLNGSQLIGVAGTVTSLAYIASKMNSYNPVLLNEFKLSLAQISEFILNWKTKTVQQLEEAYPVVLKGRSDIILSGLIILETAMKMLQKEELLVSTGGIRHGALLKSL